MKIIGDTGSSSKKATDTTYTEAAIKEKLYSNDNMIDISRLVGRDLRETVLQNTGI